MTLAVLARRGGGAAASGGGGGGGGAPTGTFSAQLVRMDGGSGTTTPQFGLALPQGAITAATTGNIRVYLSSVEQRIAVNVPSQQTFSDGSLRFVHIQLQPQSVSDGSPISGYFSLNTARGTTDISWSDQYGLYWRHPSTDVVTAPSMPGALFCCTDAAYLCSTEMVPVCITQAQATTAGGTIASFSTWLVSTAMPTHWASAFNGSNGTALLYDSCERYMQVYAHTGDPEWLRRGLWILRKIWIDVYVNGRDTPSAQQNISSGYYYWYMLAAHRGGRSELERKSVDFTAANWAGTATHENRQQGMALRWARHLWLAGGVYSFNDGTPHPSNDAKSVLCANINTLLNSRQNPGDKNSVIAGAWDGRFEWQNTNSTWSGWPWMNSIIATELVYASRIADGVVTTEGTISAATINNALVRWADWMYRANPDGGRFVYSPAGSGPNGANYAISYASDSNNGGGGPGPDAPMTGFPTAVFGHLYAVGKGSTYQTRGAEWQTQAYLCRSTAGEFNNVKEFIQGSWGFFGFAKWGA